VHLDQEDWRNRIRSLVVGPGATVTVYTDTTFTGISRQFAPDSKPARFESAISARIKSLVIACPVNNP